MLEELRIVSKVLGQKLLHSPLLLARLLVCLDDVLEEAASLLLTHIQQEDVKIFESCHLDLDRLILQEPLQAR